MKKALKIGSLVLIVLGLSSIAALYLPVRKTSTPITPLFASFPVNESRIINFSGGEEVEINANQPDPVAMKDRERQRLDQLRDWCLLTLISSSGLSPKEVAETTYDLPAIRDENLRRVANFEYGETRSRVIANGKVVALIPSNAEGEADTPRAAAARRDNLARVADEQRKNLGALPEEFIVFEYTLTPGQNSARITRRDNLPGKELFTPRYGYHESEIRNLDELRAFMEMTDDLTYASKSSTGLKVGGRKHLRELGNGELPYGHIGLEEVAAIWRGQQGLKEYQGCGFSLDPRLDMNKIAGRLGSDIAPYLPLEPVSKAREILARKPQSRDEAHINELEFAQTLYSGCDQTNNSSNCQKYLYQLFWDNSYQTARYEGQHLAGTETGMVLFYTDLLMKLWSFDLVQSSPGHDRIPGFPTSGIQVSNTHKNELDRAPESRLWLAPLTSGFQIADEKQSLLFTRNSTRVFAHPSNLVTGDDLADPEPNIFHRVFINWWNDHYEEIARYEPQYERLNEIVKWSVLINWLDEQEQTTLLGFLADNAPGAVPVTRVNYFTEWKDKHPELTFRNWDKIKFDKQADARGENESLDIIKSDLFPAFGGITWEGGVSLASRTAVTEAAETSAELELLPAATRRAGMDALRSDLTTASRLRTLDATEFTFKNFSDEAVSTLAKAKPSARLTDAFGELQNVGFDRTIRSTSEGFLMRTRAEGGRVLGDLGDLRITKSPGGYNVRWQSRDIDLGQSLGRRLSTTDNPARLLANNAEVDSTIIVDNNRYFVKLRGTDQWIKFARADSESATITKGFQARVAGIGNDVKPIDIAWLDKQAVQAELRSSGYIKINPAKGGDGVVMECCAQELPKGSKEFLVERGDVKVKAFRDGVDDLYVRVEDIPANLRVDLARLATSGLSPDDLVVARNLEAGQYRELANKLTRDPAAFRNQLNRIMADGIERNNRLITQGHFDEALAETSRLIDVHGNVPELTYQRALLEAGSKKVTAAAEALNNTISRPLQNAEKFFNEVEFRLQNTIGAEQQANLRRIADFADWNQYSQKSGEIISFTKNGELELGLRTTSLPKGQVVGAKELQIAISRGEPIYLPDSPGFANVNVFTPQGEASMGQLISLRRVEVLRVPLNDVSHFRPGALQELNTHSTWNLSNYNTFVRAAQHYIRYNPQRCDSEAPNCYVYIVRPVPGGN